jgi:FkbM family methyltransferase
MGAASRFLKRIVPIQRRNAIRLALKRHPIQYRTRWPDLAMFNLAKNDVVFDVGANVGQFAECVLAFQPWAIVHAFEPVSDAYDALERKFTNHPGVHCRNFALGAQSCQQEINVSSYVQASSFLENGRLLENRVYGIDFTRSKCERVRVKTLAGYAHACGVKNIALLKLDVQGYELEVLKGAESVLDRIRHIYCEAQFQELYKNGPMFDEVFEFLSNRGFELLRMTQFRADDDGRLMECDMIFRSRLNR